MWWGATSINTATFTRTSRLLKLWQCASVSGSIHCRFVINATPVLSTKVYISISWHKVTSPSTLQSDAHQERSTTIRQAIPNRKKVPSRSERQCSTQVTAHIAGSHGVRRTASLKGLFLLLRGSNQALQGPRHFQRTWNENGVEKNKRNKTESPFYCWKRYREAGIYCK